MNILKNRRKYLYVNRIYIYMKIKVYRISECVIVIFFWNMFCFISLKDLNIVFFFWIYLECGGMDLGVIFFILAWWFRLVIKNIGLDLSG